MKSKAEFIKHLHELDSFRRALGHARTNAERKKITSAAEDFVSSFAEILGPIIERAERDPEFKQQLAGRLAEGQELVTSNDPNTSGSSE